MTKMFIALLLAAALLLAVPAQAAQVDADQVYCFTQEDFSPQEEPLVGICITGLPESRAGTVFLGSRVLQPGDILTAEQVSQMTFAPVRTEYDGAAEVTYLPIYQGRVAPASTMSIAIRGKEDKAPVAQDHTQETYKNLPLEGSLKAHDPESEALTYTLMRQPRRGTVEIREDGTFTYTPKKNKVGVDSFTYTATDPAGKVSREATVTIQILKPTDDKRYADTAQFEAQWLRNTGLFQGETVGNALCFQPERCVSRGEFLAVVMQLFSNAAGAEVLKDTAANAAGAEDLKDTAANAAGAEDLKKVGSDAVPQWLQPYYAAAMRSGFLVNFPLEDLDAPISGREAAVLLQNILDLTGESEEEFPTFADTALAAMSQNGIAVADSEALTRAEMATMVYQASRV